MSGKNGAAFVHVGGGVRMKVLNHPQVGGGGPKIDVFWKRYL